MNAMDNQGKEFRRHSPLALVLWVTCLEGWSTTTRAASVALVMRGNRVAQLLDCQYYNARMIGG
jgi:hypothetical protein